MKQLKTLRRTAMLTLLLTAAGLCPAQTEADTVQYYIYYRVWLQRSKERPDRKWGDGHVLELARHSSHYYSWVDHENNRLLDSVRAQGGGYYDYVAVRDKKGVNSTLFHYDIYKNVPSAGRCTVFMKMGMNELYRYEEPLPAPDWEPLEGDTIIQGYACQRAQATVRGKTWQVWYAPDLPISDGPLKLGGLPGLILHAEDTEREFKFDCNGIQKGNGRSTIKLIDKKYIKTTPKKLEKMIILEASDKGAYFKSKDFPPMYAPDGRPYPWHQLNYTPCLWEKSE